MNAVERLQEQASRQGTPDHLFTSNLSPNELALMQNAGCAPLGQLTGSAIYAIGRQWRTPIWKSSDEERGLSYEMETLTQGFYQGCSLALGRMQQEAALLGATGVVGVRLNLPAQIWSDTVAEFVAIGTGIREAGIRPRREAPVPTLTTLTGQDFFRLRQAGYRPAGLVIGNCAYYHIPSMGTRLITNGSTGGSRQNQELRDYTQALYEARALAMKRLKDEARAASAEGVVNLKITIGVHPRGTSTNLAGMLYHFTVFGTAIARGADAPALDFLDTAIWLS